MGRLRNPNDLIRIEDAIKVLCRKTCHPGIACPDIYCKEMWDEFEDVERVDAVTVRRGKWVDDSNGIEGAWNYCSVCGEQAIDLYDYCPNCGARMDGNGDGNG